MSVQKSKGANEILVFVSGIVPRDDIENLKRQRIIELLGPGMNAEILERRRGRN